ncbi:MAG: transporter [Deltaproteobacteria bacterium]
MKRIALTIFFAVGFFIASVAVSFACDFCLLSQGISPLETQKGAGIRINQRYALSNKVYDGAKKITVNPEAKEEYWTTEFTGFYGVTENLTLIGVVPLKKTSMDGHLHVHADGEVEVHSDMMGDASGLGDMAALGRYSFFKKHTLDATTTVAGLVGIKFATGKTDKKMDDGMFLDAHLQPGTGSTDYLLGLSLSHAMQRLSLSANLLGSITTTGKAGDNKHRFGNSLNYDLTAKHRVHPWTGAIGPQIFLALGVNGELRDREKEEGVEEKNSGGHTAYLSPGVQIVLAPHWVFEVSYHQAVYHNLYGKQLGENYKANGAVTYLF